MLDKSWMRWFGTLSGIVALGLLGSACDAGTPPSPPSSHHTKGSGAMRDMPAGDGLSSESNGIHLTTATTTLPAGQPTEFRFTIMGPAGHPVTAFEPDQTKLLHAYLIRTDLTGFQHVHPTMAADGTWAAPLAALDPGTYRFYTTFSTDVGGKPTPFVLSQPLTVPGDAVTTPLPPAATTTQVDGYTLTLSSSEAMVGMSHPLTVTLANHGQPVTDLQPYLESYAHLTAFHAGDEAFAHIHPHDPVTGDHGGPTLTFEPMFPKPGAWRLFLQFQTAGTLHTAAVTITVH